MDYRVQTTWRHHRKRKRLKRLLGADGVLAIEDLWSHAADMHTDGILFGMSAEDMADEVDYTGDAAEMLCAFVDVKLVDAPTDAIPHYHLHDWADHQPWIIGAASRSSAAAKAAKKRWAKRGVKIDG